MYFSFKKKQDAGELALVKRFVKEGDVVLDIGANIGFYASVLAKLVGENGKVHCFEPDKTNYQHLLAETVNLKNVVTNNKAVGPKTEKLKIYTSKELNVDHRTYKPEEYDEEIEIDSVSIDDYLNTDLNVNFVKMDIQGFEMQAVKGMAKTLSQNKDIKLVSEFWPYGLKTSGSSVIEYFEHLSNLGFKCYLLKGKNLELLDHDKVKAMEPLGKESYFNILASRSDV